MRLMGKSLSQSYSPDEIIDLLYNTGFRLTGSNRETAELISKVLAALTWCKKIKLKTALKALCSVYIKTDAEDLKQTLYHNNSGMDKVQKALLKLPQQERLVVVLREILGLDYDAISNMTGLKKKDVSKLLAVGRSCLVKQLLPSTEEPKRALQN